MRSRWRRKTVRYAGLFGTEDCELTLLPDHRVKTADIRPRGWTDVMTVAT